MDAVVVRLLRGQPAALLDPLRLQQHVLAVVLEVVADELHVGLREPGSRAPVGLPVAGPIGAFREPLRIRTGPGVSITIQPDGHTLADLVDGYVFLPQ